MGLLDDAIKEHLELKRRRGADAGEITRLESEALGPVPRSSEGVPELSDDFELPHEEVEGGSPPPAAPSSRAWDEGEVRAHDAPAPAPPPVREPPPPSPPLPVDDREPEPPPLSADEPPSAPRPLPADEPPVPPAPSNYEAPPPPPAARYEPPPPPAAGYEPPPVPPPPSTSSRSYEPPPVPPPPSTSSRSYEPPPASSDRDAAYDPPPRTPPRASSAPGYDSPPVTPPPTREAWMADDRPRERPAPRPEPEPEPESGGLFSRLRGGRRAKHDRHQQPPPPAHDADLFEPATRPPSGRKDLEQPGVEHEPDIVAADEEPDVEDLLEETPEFLEETPEHDRLWFEQRPPRDFNFDD
ncbi:MAG: hypothetical protein ACLGI5_15060 [Thermoleophilia bacterium]